MGSNNPVLGLCLLSNQVQVNCGSVAGKYAMWWAVLFKVSENLLLQRDILNNSLFQESKPQNG